MIKGADSFRAFLYVYSALFVIVSCICVGAFIILDTDKEILHFPSLWGRGLRGGRKNICLNISLTMGVTIMFKNSECTRIAFANSDNNI